MPRNVVSVEEQMESEPFEIQDLSCSPGKKFMEMRQTIGEVTSDEGIADDDPRGNERVFVSSVSWYYTLFCFPCKYGKVCIRAKWPIRPELILVSVG